jgi:ACS family glucarate transporter-like MFS transporter
VKYRHRLLFLLFSLSMITFLDRVCISVAGPQIQHDLNISAEQWGWILGAFSLAYAAFEIPTGMMGDRVGPRRVLTRIVLWWSAFTALTGAAVSYPIMLVTRFCFGIGEAGAFPNISASISRWFPAVERARAQGWIWTATRVGSALSPVLVVPIQIYFGWRVTFWIFGGMGVVWTVVWLWWYRDDPSAKRGVTQSELDEIGVQKTGTRHQVDWRTAFRSPEVRTIMLMYFCYCYAAYFFISWLHTFLV